MKAQSKNPKRSSSKLVAAIPTIALITTAIALLASTTLLSACHLTVTRYNLARPANNQDWLLIWKDPEEATSGLIQNPDYRIRAGEPIFGYAAPLDNYLPISRINLEKRGEKTVESWVDSEAPASYFLPLYDEEGPWWTHALLLWREQHAVLIAHSFDDDYLKYISVKEQLESHLALEGIAVTQHRIFATWIGFFVLAETEEGAYAQFFSDFGVPEDEEAPYTLEVLQGKVLSEEEIVHIFEAIYDFAAGQAPAIEQEGIFNLYEYAE